MHLNMFRPSVQKCSKGTSEGGLNTHLSPLGRDVFRPPTLRAATGKNDRRRPIPGHRIKSFAELNSMLADTSKARMLRNGMQESSDVVY